MRALVGLLVAVLVLVFGGLPAIALVLDDDASPEQDRGYQQEHGTGPYPWMHDSERGPMPPAVARCLRAAPDPGNQDGVRPGAPDDSVPGDIPQWRDKSLRSFAHCLRLLQGGPPTAGSPG